MENKKHCKHVLQEKCAHPELGGGVIGHRLLYCTICEYFTPKRLGRVLTKGKVKAGKKTSSKKRVKRK